MNLGYIAISHSNAIKTSNFIKEQLFIIIEDQFIAHA